MLTDEQYDCSAGVAPAGSAPDRDYTSVHQESHSQRQLKIQEPTLSMRPQTAQPQAETPERRTAVLAPDRWSPVVQ